MTTPQVPGYTPDPNQTPTPPAYPPPADPAAYPPTYPPPGPGGYQPGPQGYVPPPAPPAKKTNWLGIAVLVVIVAVIGGGLWFFRDRLSANVTELAIGDCFDEPTATETITDIQHQPCNSAHDAEVIASLTHPAGSSEAYPVVSGFDDYIEENCIPIFESYTGREWDTEFDLALRYFRPTLTGWGEGDRGFTCYVSRADGGQMSATVRGIGTSPLP